MFILIEGLIISKDPVIAILRPRTQILADIKQQCSAPRRERERERRRGGQRKRERGRKRKCL